MKLAFAVALVGCAVEGHDTVTTPDGPPAPVVDSMTPTSGGYGTAITITGHNFGDATLAGYVDVAQTVAYDDVQGSVADDCGLQNLSWSDTQISGTIDFPCTSGVVTVHAQANAVQAGAFSVATTWNPGPGFDVGQFVTAQPLASGAVAALYRTQYVDQLGEVGLAVFAGSATGVYPLPGMPLPADMGTVFAKIVDGDDGSPVVIGTTGNGGVAMYYPSGSGSAAAVYSDLDGDVIAAARDGSGMYAWIATTAGIERVRPANAWTVDRGPIEAADDPLDAAIGSDGTLWIAISEPNTDDPFDYEAYSSLQSLPPAATAFTAIERADPTSYDDFISRSQIVLAPDGIGMVVVAFCEDNGTHIETTLPIRQRTAASTWIDAPVASAYAFTATALAGATTDASGSIAVVPDLTMPAVATSLPAYPFQVQALVVASSGALQPILGPNSAFAPTPQ